MHKKILGICLVILFLSMGLVFAESKKPNLQAINSSIGLFSEDDIVEAEDITVFDILRAIIFWLSPGVFFVGILLVLYGNYKKLETMLSKEMGIRKKIFPKLENYDYTFQRWLLERNTLIGVIFIACAITFFFVLR
jgi:hypothetical protein